MQGVGQRSDADDGRWGALGRSTRSARAPEAGAELSSSHGLLNRVAHRLVRPRMHRVLDRNDYRNVAWLLIEAHGRHAVEFARKRAVSGRFMGDPVESQDWLRVGREVALILRSLRRLGPGALDCQPALSEMTESPGAENAVLNL
jgi:hypothetical protein